jgi:hypothetical protein
MKRPTLGRLEQFDPVSIVFALHMTGLLLAQSVRRPLPIAVMTLSLVAVRLFLRSWPWRRNRLKFWDGIRSVVTFLLIGGVIVADGGTESPFFFWLLLLVTWEAVTASPEDFRNGVVVATGVYVTVVLLAGDVTPTSVARFGLFVAFILALAAGRLILGVYESRIRRLELMVTSLLSVATQGVVLYDADRQTPLFANQLAHELGLADHAAMARLVPDDAGHTVKIDTLASLVEDAGWLPYAPRLFRFVGDPNRKLRVGIQALRVANAAPVILVYGEEVGEADSSPPSNP